MGSSYAAPSLCFHSLRRFLVECREFSFLTSSICLTPAPMQSTSPACAASSSSAGETSTQRTCGRAASSSSLPRGCMAISRKWPSDS